MTHWFIVSLWIWVSRKTLGSRAVTVVLRVNVRSLGQEALARVMI
jgi:hypothetical protein